MMQKSFLHFFLIALTGLLIYSNTFSVPFQWDEDVYIKSNPIVQDLDHFFHPGRAAGHEHYETFRMRYIGFFTFALNYRVHGLNVAGYHAVNLLIHLANAVLVYFLVLLTLRTPYLERRRPTISDQQAADSNEPRLQFAFDYSRLFALAVALLFIAHPIQTEAVTYIFQRFASLAAFFFLASLVLYIKGRLSAANSKTLKNKSEKSKTDNPKEIYLLQPSMLWYLLSLVSAALAMKTKENAFTLPLIITIYEFLFFNSPLKKRIPRLVPWLLTMLIIPVGLIGRSGSSEAVKLTTVGYVTETYKGVSALEYLFTQFRVIVTYLRLLFFPLNQNLDYDYPVYRSFFNLPVIFSFLLLSALFGAAVYLVYKSRQKARGMGHETAENNSATYPIFPPTAENLLPTAGLYRVIAFGIFWFFISLSVESGIFPLATLIDEYRVYLPSIGFFFAATACAFLLFKTAGQKTKGQYDMRHAVLAVVVIVGLLSITTYMRNSVWKSRISLWEDVVSKSPGKPRARHALGYAYYSKGLLDRAVEQYETAIRLDPDYAEPYNSLGTAYWSMGRQDEAEQYFRSAVGVKKDFAEAHFNLGIISFNKGVPDAAIKHFETALEIKPDYLQVHGNLAAAYFQKGLIEQALHHFRIASEQDALNPDAHFNLGRAYMAAGRTEEARKEFEIVLRIRPDDREALRNLEAVK